MSETVVDRLEVVDVEKEHRDRIGQPAASVHGVGEPVKKQGSVRKAGERVMEGLPLELLLEDAAVGHVAAVENDRADIGLIEEIGDDDIDRQPLALGVGYPAFEAGRGAKTATEHFRELGLRSLQIVWMDEVAQQMPDERVG